MIRYIVRLLYIATGRQSLIILSRFATLADVVTQANKIIQVYEQM